MEEGGWGRPLWPYEYDGTFISSDQIESGKWHHVAFVLDVWENPHNANIHVATKNLDTFSAYLGGRLMGRGVGARVSAHYFGEPSGDATSSTLGAARWATRLHGDNCEWGSCSESLHFTGRIDDVRIYDRVLSSAEIALLALDADDDALLDECETGTGVYVSEYDTGTSLVLGDSDADGFSDFEEVEAGSDPNNHSSTPENVPAVPSLVGWAAVALCFCLVAGMVLTTKRYRRV